MNMSQVQGNGVLDSGCKAGIRQFERVPMDVSVSIKMERNENVEGWTYNIPETAGYDEFRAFDSTDSEKDIAEKQDVNRRLSEAKLRAKKAAEEAIGELRRAQEMVRFTLTNYPYCTMED